MPPRNKKPRFSRTSELKNRAWGNRSSATEDGSDRNNSNNVVSAAAAASAGVAASAVGGVDLASVRDQGVVVLVRIRPTSQSELDQGQRSFLQVQGAAQVRESAEKEKMSMQCKVPTYIAQPMPLAAKFCSV